MKEFFKKVIKNLVAMFVSLVLFYILFIFIVAAFTAYFEKPLVTVKEKSVLVFDLSANIADSPREETPMEVVRELAGRDDGRRYTIYKLVESIDRAAADDRVSALFLHGNIYSENYGSSFAALREVRGAVERFAKSGKPVIAYLLNPTMHDYYVVSAAETKIMHPLSFMEFKGLAANFAYLGDTLEKYGVGVQATRAGKYKSAVEMFTRNSMSEPEREQTTELLESLWGALLADVSLSLGIGEAELREYSESPGLFTAEMALERGLINEIAYFDAIRDRLEEIGGYDEDIESFTQVALADYQLEDYKVHPSGEVDGWDGDRPEIAVVYVEGEIVGGEGYKDQAGGERIAGYLREIREEGEVDALILRVNSPGGSALAAEQIEREVHLLSREMPVITSMGGFAASGGYWVSARTDRIFAEPSTVTGSIGVFGLFPNIEGLAHKHGVNFESVKTSPNADIFTLMRPKTEAELGIIQTFIDEIYGSFLDKVAEGRDMTKGEVDAIAQGRVWSGEMAVGAGLVDEVGGLFDAVKHAASEAGITDYDVVHYPRKKSLQEIFEDALNGGPSRPVASELHPMGKAGVLLESKFPILRSLSDPRGMYARMPFDIYLR